MSLSLPPSSLSRRSALLGALGVGVGAMVPILSATTDAFAYSTTVTANYPVLREGSSGVAVRIVQGITRAAVDGQFGAGTKSAVITFQRNRGLVADGIVGAATWGALLNTVRSGDNNNIVRGVQARLYIAVDGAFGPATHSAVVSFQRNNGLTADGIVGPNTWARMVGASSGSTGPVGTSPRKLYTNGRLPSSALASVGFGVWRVSTYCVNDFKAMNAAFKATFGTNLPISSGSSSAYRTYDEQVYFWNLYLSGKGNLAARPGTSNHGWGLAVDIGVAPYGSTKYNWLNANAGRWGFNDDVSGEPWHWAYQR
ncbi:peptidoglycan-binding protein [Propionibacteriaceae bacterium G1746]